MLRLRRTRLAPNSQTQLEWVLEAANCAYRAPSPLHQALPAGAEANARPTSTPHRAPDRGSAPPPHARLGPGRLGQDPAPQRVARLRGQPHVYVGVAIPRPA